MLTIDVAILGGGASGLAAAVALKQQNSSISVCVLEKNPRVGKKLLITGNGRCNIGNLHFEEKENYYGSCTQFLSDVFSHTKDTVSFFQEMGLHCRADAAGRLYPYSNQASSVLDALRLTAEQLGVILHCDFHIESIQRNGSRFILQSENIQVSSSAVIISCGGKACPKTGSDGDFLPFLMQLGHTVTTLTPGLVPLYTESSQVKSLKGVRVHAAVSAWGKNGKRIAGDKGEVQFTDRGLSGICVMNLSAWNIAKIQYVSCNLLPEKTNEQVAALLWELYALRATWRLEDWLTGLLPKKLSHALLHASGVEKSFEAPVYQLTTPEIEQVCKQIQDWRFPIVSRGTWQEAQVTIGGVPSHEIDNTLMSRLVKGLYFTGEVLDVHGGCGGYNLEWAWHSGQYVAKHIAAYVKKEACYND